MRKAVRILLVEDDSAFAVAIQQLIQRKAPFDADVVTVYSLKDALMKIEEKSIDVVLLDLNLRDSYGIETVVQMRQCASGTPIIILTGQNDEELAIRALQEGAQDYLVKGDIDGKLLFRSVQYAIERGKMVAEREDFVATLTHDLKGPLQGANRILELLVKGTVGPLEDAQIDMLVRLIDNNFTLLEMIANLLEVYRYEKDINTIKFAHTNLVNLVNSCTEEVLYLAKDRAIEIRRDIVDDRDISILADPPSIKRVLRNLLDNAIKFTPTGGVVTVKVSQDSEKVKLAVSDTGPGIPDEDKRYLFERFFRGSEGKRYSRSTGLGLYLCRQIVQHHNGTITCDRAEGESGTMFLLEFPAYAPGFN